MAKTSRTAKRNLFIFIVAVILVIVVAAVIIYFAAPDVFDKILAAFDDKSQSQGTTDPPLVRGEGELMVHFIDVGQGDCILILFPDGKDMLIDCANYNNSSDYRTETLDYIDDYVTDGQLDYLMLTHCDSDHVYFMDEVLEEYRVSNVFMPNVLATHDEVESANIDEAKLDMFTDKDTVETACYADFFVGALTEPDCNIYLNVDPDENTNAIVITDDGVQDPDAPDTDATYRLTFYCPTQEYYDESNLGDAEKKNAISPIGILEYNGFRLVLTGDSNEINEPTFVERVGGNLDCDVLKVGHHGSESSSTEEFLDAIDCEYAVISCNAEGNTFYHPRQTTLDRFVERDMTIYRTDNNGNIVLTVRDESDFEFTCEVQSTQEQNEDGWTDEEIDEAKGE